MSVVKFLKPPIRLTLEACFCHIAILLFYALTSCSQNNQEPDRKHQVKGQEASKSKLFSKLAVENSRIDFVNCIQESPNFNYFIYPFIYFGGGVAIGDINNDNLPDIYFTSSMGLNALYLNRGNLTFENITKKAGVQGTYNRWSTGVTMTDINSDGLLDIYISVAGPNPIHRANQLFVNQGNNTFFEQAVEFGIADEGHSMQSAFFDYDLDGDLDLYVCNYSPQGFAQSSSFFAEQMKNPRLIDSDRLYENIGGKFLDVTKSAGILNYGLSLGISVSDFNNDLLPDVYVSNDFNSSDYLYINQGNGKFENEIEKYLMHTSNFGMGTDVADINNDGHVDLMQLDMMSSMNQQQKANMSAMNPEKFQELIDLGLQHQYMKNTLQLNTGVDSFSEIGELAGVAYSDWSWSTLLMDMNNNGHKDIFITNGMRRNVNDNDFNAFFRIQKAYNKIDPSQYYGLLQKIPVSPVENCTFLNNGDLTFSEVNERSGLNFKGFSNGSAYADLDLDGDLDVVVNNLDAPSHVFENLTKGTNYLRVRLKGTINNQWGVGSKVYVYNETQIQTQELQLTRGFQSSSEPILHFGLGSSMKVDSLKVFWPNGKMELIKNLSVNQTIELDQKNASIHPKPKFSSKPIFSVSQLPIDAEFVHLENEFNDFEREVLLPHKMSQMGPALAVGDVNQDGLDDFYIGGAKGQSGKLFIQSEKGSFSSTQNKVWNSDKKYEDVSASFFDANNDGLLDLYVVSGSNEAIEGSSYYEDRLYLNKQGVFNKQIGAMPELYISGSCVKPIDYDQDGDLDLFVGGRQSPGNYPLPTSSYILRNESVKGSVSFENVTDEVAPLLIELGMVTDASWNDFNGDGWQDLLIVGEWMSIVALENNKGIFKNVSATYGLNREVGWWNCIESADIDNDGDLDFVVGNLGLNYKYKSSITEPFKVYAGDFDENDHLDIVLGFYEKGELYPLRGRECSSQQIPSIKKKFPNYTAFSTASLSDVYSPEKLDSTLNYEAYTFSSTVFINEKKKFKSRPLENLAQMSSINAMVLKDFDKDGFVDLLVGGNKYGSEVETPRSDASKGLFLLGDGTNSFQAVPPLRSGLNLSGEVRFLSEIKLAQNKTGFLVARNNEGLLIIQ
ncbi:MAG: VCBS repeat-containing protein [Reichenbachiella sp.]